MNEGTKTAVSATAPRKTPGPEWRERAETLLRRETSASPPFRWEPLHGDGSDRTFYRLVTAQATFVLLWSPPADTRSPNESDSYVYMGRHLERHGIRVPKIFGYWRDEGLVLLEDLGSIHLQDAVRSGSASQVEGLYQQAADVLVRIQVQASEGLDTGQCFDTPLYSPDFVMERELRYFYQSFVLGALGVKITWDQIEDELSLLAERAARVEEPSFFLHRDFQSRNLMVKEGRLYVIDFQGSRRGPSQYDLAALLLDPYVRLPEPLAERLLREHAERLHDAAGISVADFLEGYEQVALCRNLQILAAYSFLTRVKGRRHFARYLVPAYGTLQQGLGRPACKDYRFLRGLVRDHGIGEIAEVAARLEREAGEGRQ
ncbi:MAG TPA: phosphotransferase [Syntrophobacteria bacterium]|nr:phosphotransferase [Syntrophobacteria bacterium]